MADTAEEKFLHYYDRFMPNLKYIMQNALSSDYRMLRGKTIECISLIGLAVGKEKVSVVVQSTLVSIFFSGYLCVMRNFERHVNRACTKLAPFSVFPQSTCSFLTRSRPFKRCLISLGKKALSLLAKIENV